MDDVELFPPLRQWEDDDGFLSTSRSSLERFFVIVIRESSFFSTTTGCHKARIPLTSLALVNDVHYIRISTRERSRNCRDHLRQFFFSLSLSLSQKTETRSLNLVDWNMRRSTKTGHDSFHFLMWFYSCGSCDNCFLQ
jgi:hypothetical protein